MDKIPKKDLKKVVFDFLAQCGNLEALSLKDLKRHVEQKFELPIDSIKREESAMLKELVGAYKPSHAKAAKEKDDEYLKGKFSTEDSELILKTVRRYAKENSLDITMVSNFFGADVEKKNPHAALYSELASLLPHRKPKAIYQHANRLLIRPNVDGSFSEKEKNQLRSLIKIHGHDFVGIARIMGKAPDDCKQMTTRLTARLKSGRFSPEEDTDIINSVRTLLASPETAVVDLPDNGIPWTEVANLMKNERYPLDYNRRWIYIKKNHARETNRLVAGGLQPSAAKSAATPPETPNTVAIRKKDDYNRFLLPLLKVLKASNPQDESEVNWTLLNRKFAANHNATQLLWKRLQKDCAAAEDGSSMTFSNKVDFLLAKYGQGARLNAEEPSPFPTDVKSSSSKGGAGKRSLTKGVKNVVATLSPQERLSGSDRIDELALRFGTLSDVDLDEEGGEEEEGWDEKFGQEWKASQAPQQTNHSSSSRDSEHHGHIVAESQQSFNGLIDNIVSQELATQVCSQFESEHDDIKSQKKNKKDKKRSRESEGGEKKKKKKHISSEPNVNDK